jgi:hypothetical protein
VFDLGKWLICTCLFFVLLGCTTKNNEMTGGRPPKAMLHIGNIEYETKLGTYCWKATCVDTVGPVELLKDQKPIKVNTKDEITFVMDYQPKPNEFHLEQSNGGIQTEVELKDDRFTAPAQKGTYYYSYGVWWMDDKVAHLSHGDAFYAFVLEVK